MKSVNQVLINNLLWLQGSTVFWGSALILAISLSGCKKVAQLPTSSDIHQLNPPQKARFKAWSGLASSVTQWSVGAKDSIANGSEATTKSTLQLQVLDSSLCTNMQTQPTATGSQISIQGNSCPIAFVRLFHLDHSKFSRGIHLRSEIGVHYKQNSSLAQQLDVQAYDLQITASAAGLTDNVTGTFSGFGRIQSRSEGNIIVGAQGKIDKKTSATGEVTDSRKISLNVKFGDGLVVELSYSTTNWGLQAKEEHYYLNGDEIDSSEGLTHFINLGVDLEKLFPAL